MNELSTYLTFDGNAREAMSFYQRCLGADLDIKTFGEMPMPCPDLADKDKDRVMHARLSKGSLVLMAADTMPGMPFTQGNNFSICINCESIEETESLFNAFSDKGTATMPLQQTFWAVRFGMLTDRFGINWMFNFGMPGQG